MPRKPQEIAGPSISFPYFLSEEEDRWLWVKTLYARQAAFEEFHRQVMDFLLPQQIELKREWADWWEKFEARHSIPKETKLRLKGRVVELAEDDQKQQIES